jgi:hypothetical protein
MDRKKESTMSIFQKIWMSTCAVILAALVVSAPSARAFDTELSRSSLAGINGVTVAIEGSIEKTLEQEGLTKDKLKVDVGSQLQEAGISLLSDMEFLETKQRPLLILTINTLKQDKGYIFSVTVQLYQQVYLIPESQDMTYPPTTSPATTWSSPGTIGIFYDPEDLRVLIKEAVDEFTTAYRLVNPL